MRVLGISPFHDSSVAIINDGRVEYFTREERLSRVKRDDHPYKTLSYIIKNIEGNIDIAVIGDEGSYVFLETMLRKIFDCEVVRMCDDHHLTHASLAFHNSGFQTALVAVIDRQGSIPFYKDRGGFFGHGRSSSLRESESVFKVDQQEYDFKPIYKSFWLNKIGENYDLENYKEVLAVKKSLPSDCEVVAESSMGITKVYETATTLIGQHPLENGKTMGLAAYGKDKEFKDLFVDGVPNNNLFLHDYPSVFLKEYYHFKMSEGTPLPKDGYEVYADYAYQVQKQTQNQVLDLIKKKVDDTGINNVCVTGGYGLNVVSNENLVKNLPNVNFFFEPLADDSGNSIGAALCVYRQKTNDREIYKLKDTFFNHIKHPIEVEGTRATLYDIAKLLDNQKIVAVFNGQAETGPRALGNRSILFDARNPKAKDIINTIKNREWYRPVACSILKEAAKDYFEMYNLIESPYMTISFPIKEKKKQVIPGVIHIDDSCRIQTVDTDIEHYYKLLKEFEKITGVPVLLNTSFNVAGEPLVETVKDAIDTFKKTNIDVLWFPEKEIILTK